MPALFEPIKVGSNITLQHRIAMAPLTRMRATSSHTHTAMATEYYSQRSNTPGTLIISEATFISPEAGGFAHVPGIWSFLQIQAWKEIATAVHSKKSFLYLQLWALGRAAPASFLAASPGGPYKVVSASNIGLDPKGESRGKDVPTPLSVAQIKEYVNWYAQAAKNFVQTAGGDGVEVHCANGYLIDQFLQKNSNVRDDIYGGSVENRCRFGLEVIDAVVRAVGADKVGFRLSPHSTFQGMKMSPADIEETFSYFVRAIKKAHPDLAYLHATEARVAGGGDQASVDEETLDFLHDIWAPKVFIVAGTYTAETALQATDKRSNVIVAFGRYFISNPDLVERIRNSQPFTPYNRKTFYLLGETQSEGYTDYPPYENAGGQLSAKF